VLLPVLRGLPYSPPPPRARDPGVIPPVHLVIVFFGPLAFPLPHLEIGAVLLYGFTDRAGLSFLYAIIFLSLLLVRLPLLFFI